MASWRSSRSTCSRKRCVTGLHGMRVDRVVAGTPAARFGLKADDIITAVDDTPLYDSDGLVLEVGKLPVEAVTRLSIVRDGHRRSSTSH